MGLTELEEFSYASFPTGGRFRDLLDANSDDTKIESSPPHRFTGKKFVAGDFSSFDYLNSEEVRHTAFVRRWDGRRYWIIDAQPNYGVSEHPLAHQFSLARVRGSKRRGLAD